jgi:hypothetical protein
LLMVGLSPGFANSCSTLEFLGNKWSWFGGWEVVGKLVLKDCNAPLQILTLYLFFKSNKFRHQE